MIFLTFPFKILRALILMPDLLFITEIDCVHFI